MKKNKVYITDNICIPSNKLLLIAGPCVIESREHTLFLAKELKEICKEVDVHFIFKASFDKANRSHIDAYRGPGIERGLNILQEVKEKIFVPVLSDIHETWQAKLCADVLDVIQIPAFLSRQTDLLLSAGYTQKTINIKKGQFVAPWNMKEVIEKVLYTGNKNILLTERGSSFGYNQLVMDPCSIPIMSEFGFPIIIDATHSVQKPGAGKKGSGGNRDLAPYIANAGLAVGADGIFVEVHENPEKALSDSSNSLRLSELPSYLKRWKKLFNCVNGDIK
ncbi:MAG: 3-deoxy-8-phosphooctulonate synthase [Candidatus Hydrogenedens sp.]